MFYDNSNANSSRLKRKMYTASPLYTKVNIRKKTVMPYSSYTTCYNKKTKTVTNSIRFNHSKLSDNGNNNAKTSKNSLIYNNEHYLDVSYEQSDVNIKPEPVPIKAIDSSKISNLSSCPDNKLSYTLVTLGLGHLVNEFTKNMITFNDLLLLTKEDLEELKLAFGPRNRILKFSMIYKKYAKSYNMEELKAFFDRNRNLVIKDVDMSEYKSRTLLKKESEKILIGCDNVSEIKKADDMIINDKSIDDTTNKNEPFTYDSEVKLPFRLSNIEVPEISDIDDIPEVRTFPKSVSKPKTTRKVFKEIGKKSHSIKKVRKSIPIYPIQKKAKVLNKKDKILMEYQNIFTEISNFQKSYNNMKMRSDERNIRINNLLSKANHFDKSKIVVNNHNRNILNDFGELELRTSLSNRNKFTVSGSDANDIEKINEILGRGEREKEIVN